MTDEKALARPEERALRAAEERDDPYLGLWRLAAATAKAEGMRPKQFKTAEMIFVAFQMGAEVGLSPFRALAAIDIIQGRPGWKPEAALALVRQSGKLKVYSEGVEGEGDARHGWAESQRVDQPEPVRNEFSVGDAKRARLWNKADSAWQTYPDRMLLQRARGFNLRDNFSDVLLGLATIAELGDWPATDPERNITPKGDYTVEPPDEPDPLLAGLTGPAGEESEETGASESDSSPSPQSMSDEEWSAMMDAARDQADEELNEYLSDDVPGDPPQDSPDASVSGVEDLQLPLTVGSPQQRDPSAPETTTDEEDSTDER